MSDVVFVALIGGAVAVLTSILSRQQKHMCMHLVVSSGSWYGLQGGYTRFEITIKP